MLKTYIKQKQALMNEQQIDFYTPSGLHVYFKDKLENPDIDVQDVINSVEEKIPQRKFSGTERDAIFSFRI